MLNTINKRLLFFTITFLLVMSIFVLAVAANSFRINRINRVKNTQTYVKYVGEKFSNLYDEHYSYTKRLAAIGTLFYNSKSQNKKIINETIIDNFKNHLPKAGVGIWFEPNVISKSQKWFSVFAYDKDGETVFNENLDNAQYDYFSRHWYNLIKQKALRNEQNIYTPTTCAATGKKNYVLTIGSGMYSNNKLIGIITVDWLLDAIKSEVADLKPTKNSYLLFADKENDFIITLTGTDKDVIGDSLSTLQWYKNDLKSGSIIKDNKKFYITFPQILDNGLLLIANVPVLELYGDLFINLLSITFVIMLAAVLITLMSYFILKQSVHKPIKYLLKMAEKIGNGNLQEKMEIKSPEEFARLAKAFNKMTTDIENYITNLDSITAENKRIESELAIANAIQLSALPSVFPPYPERKEFDIFAHMHPAKEVGGDFYDFFFIDKDNFVFLVADVSGKGVPASLFMMEVKMLLKNIIKTGIPVDEAMNKVNHKICKNNPLDFFVTIFLVRINLTTGETSFLNAGHNPPLIKKVNDRFEYYRIKPNLVAGVMDNFKYSVVNGYLAPGDEMFLYTDGLTEAMDNDGNLYGEEKLKQILQNNENIQLSDIIFTVKSDIKTFTAGAEQSDDMTSVVFRYNGRVN